MKWVKVFKIVAANLAVFVVLLFLVNYAAGFILRKDRKHRSDLPNYEGSREHAQEVFRDYGRVKHDYFPFVGWKTLEYNGKTTRINESGERIHTTPAFEGQKEKTVRFFGGSTMWGEGSDDEHTIPALFNRNFPQYTVHNHGQLAYNSRQELDALITLYTKGDSADVVVFYDGVNDVAFLCPSVIEELPGHRLVPMYREKIYTGRGAILRELAVKTFAENILLLAAKNSEKKEGLYNCIADPAKGEAIAEIMLRNWEIAHELVTKRGGRFIAILQPSAFSGQAKTDYLELDSELAENFAFVYGKIREKLQQRNHPWIFDLSNAFDKDDHILIDFCHVSPNGNQIIADELAAIFRAQNL